MCRQAVETATGSPVTDEAASRRVPCEACGASDAALSRDSAGPVERVPTRGLPSPGLRRVCDFIQDNLNRPLTLMELSTVVHMSPYHFARLFKQSTGVPPHHFVLGQRIAAVARLVGFRTPSHFTTSFWRMIGITPSAYRWGWRHER
jgi:AraC-like DNA-binding protein